jgi:hypothetical protein
MPQPANRTADYEVSDADPWLLAALASGGAAFLFVTPFILLLFYATTAQRGGVIRRIEDIPSPRLQVDPRQDLAAWRRAENERLSSYGWVDRDQKVVHIPIDRAIAVIAERGLPEWQRP